MQRLAVARTPFPDPATQRPQQDQAQEGDRGRDARRPEHAERRRRPDRRDDPQARRRRESSNGDPIAQDRTRAEEADTGDNLRSHPRGITFAETVQADEREQARAGGDEHVRAQAGRMFAALPLEADDHADAGGHGKADRDVDLDLRELHSVSVVSSRDEALARRRDLAADGMRVRTIGGAIDADTHGAGEARAGFHARNPRRRHIHTVRSLRGAPDRPELLGPLVR